MGHFVDKPQFNVDKGGFFNPIQAVSPEMTRVLRLLDWSRAHPFEQEGARGEGEVLDSSHANDPMLPCRDQARHDPQAGPHDSQKLGVSGGVGFEFVRQGADRVRRQAHPWRHSRGLGQGAYQGDESREGMEGDVEGA